LVEPYTTSQATGLIPSLALLVDMDSSFMSQ
jgi:hypothetical protein